MTVTLNVPRGSSSCIAVTCHLAQVGVGRAGRISELSAAAELTMIRLCPLFLSRGPTGDARG